MKKLFGTKTLMAFALLVGTTGAAVAQEGTPSPLIGRWDMTITIDGKEHPSWLEVEQSGTSTLVGRYVAPGGSARPISHVMFKDGKMSFSVPPQWEGGTGDITIEGTLSGDNLSGTITANTGKVSNWVAVRAPLLKRTAAPVWGNKIVLFDGKNGLNGWHAQSGTNQWVAENGILKSPRPGANLMTDQTFNDFKLHIEFRYPKGSNSGVYLRGRYEVQVMDSKGEEPQSHLLGGVYGFLTPSELPAKDAGEWQSYDITLVGRMVTVALNGKDIIINQAIPGITGGAIDSKEGEPGPIFLQGDHGTIEYRNIYIIPAK